ncbi:MAG: phenylacetate-CoA oxygenase subunit PaaC [Hyphomicrobiaceae bacterium]|nr:MAG: phenylacetate-CoA oxygenase subunit PaaC [Hyphomicrobiaceae bacterium]
MTELFHYVLGLADDQLVLGHRVSEWIGSAPVLEEELALANVGLDLIGASRTLFTYAGEIEGKGRDEDQLAYLRDAVAYRNLLLAELPNGDFAFTIVRLTLYAAFMTPYWEALSASKDETLSAIAAKCVKESRYHLRHAGEWLVRLGDGTEESRRRANAAVEELWPFTGELFVMEKAEVDLAQEGVAVDRVALRPAWRETVGGILREATLEMPKDEWIQSGGRAGRHTEYLGHMLAEMQSLQRTYPGAKW